MAGFEGFTEVGRRLQASQRERMVNLALQVHAFEFLVAKEFVIGHDLATGAPVRAALAERRGYEGRPTLSDLRDSHGDGAVLVLVDCVENRMGTLEARKAMPFAEPALVLTDGVASVSLPRQREDGRWGQSVQRLLTDASVRCEDFSDLMAAVAATLGGGSGHGRSGAVVRGWHPRSRKAGIMSFEIAQAWDPEARVYLAADGSLAAFSAMPDVFISGINTSASGAQCLDEAERLMGAYPDDIVWEIIPKQSFSVSGLAAEEAGLQIRRDPSGPYRLPGGRSTGFVPSVIGFADKNGSWWPRIVAPSRLDAKPVAAPYVATPHAAPGAQPRAPEASSLPAQAPLGQYAEMPPEWDEVPPPPPGSDEDSGYGLRTTR